MIKYIQLSPNQYNEFFNVIDELKKEREKLKKELEHYKRALEWVDSRFEYEGWAKMALKETEEHDKASV